MLLHGDKPHEQTTDDLILHGVNGKSIYARSINQQALVAAYEENDLLFAVGPAGSGKTYTAIALAETKGGEADYPFPSGCGSRRKIGFLAW